MRIKLLHLLLIYIITIDAQVLPHYKLTILQSNLDLMYAQPLNEVAYPAVFQVDTFKYNVTARFKGSTTLEYPKKSWAIEFPNNKNYFGVSRINLHADYKDHSAMRNFLILKLFNFYNLPTPTIKHVTYEVNGEAYGVYTQVEQINSEFLIRNNRTPISLYKAANHGGLMAPAVRDEYYKNIWSVEYGSDNSFNELRRYLNKCLYWSKTDFDNNIANTVDVNNFLTFFAVHFVFVDMDNFTKNIFLNKNSNTQKFEFIPWDNEGSFGNTAIGNFDPTFTSYNLKDSHTPEYQVVFSRLLENSAYNELFKSKINNIITNGYSYLDTLITNTYLKIKQDVYADTKKEASNVDFDNSITQLKWFMTNRKLFLQNNEIPQHKPLTDFYCSNPLPTVSNPNVTFRINSPSAQPVNIFFADSVNFNKFGQPFKFSRLQLHDDGQHDDLLANDLVYGNTINTNKFISPLIPFTITGSEQNYPPNGIFYIDYYPSKSYAINRGNTISNIDTNLEIGNIYQYNSQNFVEISNGSTSTQLDLSYCHLRTNNSYDDFMFRDNVVVAPGETIYIAANQDLGKYFFPNNRSFSDLYYNFNTNDSLIILSPLLTPIITKKIISKNALFYEAKNLVFNEINYKSGLEKVSGDWVEIYNPGKDAIDMTGWKYKDNKNSYKFPTGFTLQPDSYIVVCEDLLSFQNANPDVTNVLGSSNFGLSGSGEYILLLDKLGQLVDSVDFKTISPWPLTASGTGQTIELKDCLLDNNLGENWFADSKKFGSPGKKNYMTTELDSPESVQISIYPNPAHESVFIRNNATDLLVEIYSLQGLILQSEMMTAYSVKRLDISKLPQGIYIVKASGSGTYKTFKLIVE